MYFIGLFGWAILRLVFPDRWWWLFLMNAFSLYAFVPLPVIAIAAFFLKRRIILVPVGAAAMLGGLLYGELFLPQQSLVQADNQAQTIKVMTTNLLFSNQHTDAIVDALRRSDADVISLQELTTPVSEAIAQALRDSYPYQELHTEGFFGSGIISRYPMSEPPVTMPGNAWATRPYILRSLDVNGQQVLFLQFHATPTRMGKPSWMEQSLRIREQQAQELATLAQSYDGPFIAAGDFNATDMHYAYTLVTREMQDAWREVGWGAGQTFPSARTTDGRRASVWSIPIMPWLVRIDYVFYSGDAQATTANIGPWDGHSDHRPVVVDIQLP
jgi:endonuclease/exonuclease/phosphatase (EEP) superfamily protein YafD